MSKGFKILEQILRDIEKPLDLSPYPRKPVKEGKKGGGQGT